MGDYYSTHDLAPLVLFEGTITTNQYKVVPTDYFYSTMKYLCPGGNTLFHYESVPINVTGQFNEDKADVNHIHQMSTQ